MLNIAKSDTNFPLAKENNMVLFQQLGRTLTTSSNQVKITRDRKVYYWVLIY